MHGEATAPAMPSAGSPSRSVAGQVQDLPKSWACSRAERHCFISFGGVVTPALVLKDPYVLDFLGLEDRFLERDVEDAILRELELFLLELGAGFSFIARQKRIQLDGADFYIDLLFYNRKLKRLVVVELKQGSFKPEYKGQMELYLRWLPGTRRRLAR
jgi:hypothetical protein